MTDSPSLIAGLAIPEHIRRAAQPLPPSTMVEGPDEAAARREAARATRLRRFGARLPSRYASASLADLTPEQDPRGAVTGWLTSGHQTLLLASAEPGLGKTHAAYAVGAQAAADGLVVEAWNVSDMLSEMRREMRSEAPDETLNAVTSSDLVFLDDLGRENATAWAQEQIHCILDHRLREKRRTIITTNLTADDMGARYGYPLLDRVIDDAVIVKVTGESRRKAVQW
jgi:DNA replication protein DnaC